MELPVLLIGPMFAGKSTVGELLAQRLGVPFYELDNLRWDYYAEIGYDGAYADKLRKERGFEAMYQYWKPFEIHAVERAVAERCDGVISFGAGHSVYEDAALLERAERALAPIANVILLLPSADAAEASATLKERFIEVGRQEGFTPTEQSLGMIDHFLQHPSNARLAKHVIYTNGRSPEQTCEEILKILK